MRPGTGAFVMTITLVVLGFYLLYPMVLVLTMSFNTARDVLVPPAIWGFGNWLTAWDDPLLLQSLFNSFLIWFLIAGISFPIAITISLILSRTRIPFSYGLEFGFWVAFMFPGLSTTIGWMMLLDPDVGMINTALVALPFIDEAPFNIFSLPGIIWVKLMGDGIAYKVMLLTPAFRNMDGALEEAARTSGASAVATMFRVTLPVMISPIILIVALQLVRIFSGFETEFLLGRPFGFFVYSTLIFELIRAPDGFPEYGKAVVLASVTLAVIAAIIPLQRWIVERRHYTTVVGSFRPTLYDLGPWKWLAFSGFIVLLAVMTIVPGIVLIVGSFMKISGLFITTPLWTLEHWQFVFGDARFITALQTTTVLAVVAAIGSPILFSLLAYIMVRTRWRGRLLLDMTVWGSAAIPGIISGLGLLLMFLGTPGLRAIYGTIWALIIVVLIQGNTTGTNVFKGVLVQLGRDMEEAARVSGAGWVRTYFTIVIPVLMPTMLLIGTLNFVGAAGATASIILIASRDTLTLSLLGLEWGSTSQQGAQKEEAAIIGLVIMVFTLGVALVARGFGLRVGLRHDARAREVPRGASTGQASRSGTQAR